MHCNLTGEKLWSQLKKNADVMLYTHGRAYIKILFITAQQDLDRASTRAML